MWCVVSLGCTQNSFPPGLEVSLLTVSETLDISHMPLLSIDMKTKVVQHDPRIKKLRV